MRTLLNIRPKLLYGLLVLAALLVACSSPAPSADTVAQNELQKVSPEQDQPTELPPTPEPEDTPVSPTDTPVLPTETSAPPAETSEATPEEVEPTEPAVTPTPEAVVEYYETIPIGSTADFTASDDIAGIEGQVEVISKTEIKIRNFVSLLAPAPGVDIRLGVNGDISDDVAIVLKDITGKTYEGRTLTLKIPDKAFDGRTYDTISVMCFATGEIFDVITFEMP